jgi:predicted transcriptional regulator
MRSRLCFLRAEISEPTVAWAQASRQRRLAWEAKMIAEADADIAAGHVVDEAEVDAWIDSIDTDHELPVPYADRRSSGSM